GFAGHDINIGADILVRAALSDEFAEASGQYYDNDAKCFNAPHAEALNATKAAALLQEMEGVLAKLS
ncbi:MAG: oxidoreductase, partial [Thiolinea sp.]